MASSQYQSHPRDQSGFREFGTLATLKVADARAVVEREVRASLHLAALCAALEVLSSVPCLFWSKGKRDIVCVTAIFVAVTSVTLSASAVTQRKVAIVCVSSFVDTETC